MSSSFLGNPNNLLPENYIIPEDEEEKNLKLRQYFNDIATATNTKDSGIYDSVETITGQRFLPTFSTDTISNVTYRSVFRKVVNFGALLNNAAKSVPHGIDFLSSYSATHIYGATTDPGNLWYPLPYASRTGSQNIKLEANSTDVVVTTETNRSNFTRTFVILEYIKIL